MTDMSSFKGSSRNLMNQTMSPKSTNFRINRNISIETDKSGKSKSNLKNLH
jgi:hypothetical protein